MFNLKIGGIAGGAAFVLSLLLGLFSGAGFLVVLLRALIFTVVFFVLASGVYFLISHFLPELLDDDNGAGRRGPGSPGSMVNIALGDPEEFPPPAMARGEGFPPGDDLGDISDLMDGPVPAEEASQDTSGDTGFSRENEESSAEPFAGLDQNLQDGYTEKGKEEGNFPEEGVLSSQGPAETETFSAAADSGPSDAADLLPDLDAMAGAFLSSGGVEEAAPAESPPGRKPSVGGKPSKLEGDFDPKELAAAIRTRIKRE